MKKITIEFQDENSTEFKIDGDKLTYRELLVLSRQLVSTKAIFVPGNGVAIEVKMRAGLLNIEATQGATSKWRYQLVADELHLTAMQMFLAPIVQATAQATVQMFLQAMQEQQANQIALARMQQQGNSGFIKGVGQG